MAAVRCRIIGAATAGLAQDMKKPLLQEHLLGNVFFDTCVYHQPGIDLLTEVIPADNVLFASEMIGAVRGIDPETGHHFDDTKRYLDHLDLDEGRRRRSSTRTRCGSIRASCSISRSTSPKKWRRSPLSNCSQHPRMADQRTAACNQ